MRNLLIWLVAAISTALPSASDACSSTSSLSSVQNSNYENVGLYEWSTSLQAWILVSSGYNPALEHQNMGIGDEFVPASEFWGTGSEGGGGGGGTQPHQLRRGYLPGPATASSCEATTLPRITVSASGPGYFGTLTQLAWRGQLLNGRYGSGVARRPSSSEISVRAACPGGNDQEARELAAWAAYKQHFGVGALRQASRDTGATYTITFSNGSQGVYQRSSNPDGRASHGLFEIMAPTGC